MHCVDSSCANRKGETRKDSAIRTHGRSGEVQGLDTYRQEFNSLNLTSAEMVNASYFLPEMH